jgi:hypothetical protein
MSRGGNRPGAGRPAGSTNVDTAAMRTALAGLLEGEVQGAIEALAKRHGYRRPLPFLTEHTDGHEQPLTQCNLA